MFEFIKGLFSPKIEKQEVKLDELENWFKEQTKDRVDAIKIDLSSMFSRFDEELEGLKEKLDILEKAQLQNPSITTREKQIMEGNRAAYIARVRRFIEEISLEKNPKRVLEFYNSFAESLNNLNKTTAKSYFVLQEFFANESRKVVQGIRSLDKNVKEIKSLIERKDIKQIEAIEKEIKGLFNKIDLNENLKKELSGIREEAERDEKNKESLIKELEELKNSGEMKELQKLKRDSEELEEEINRLKAPMLHDFAVIEAALKKYSKISLEEKTVLHYLENPLSKLLKDSDFKILSILEKTKENITKGVIELKDKKKEKSLETIGKMDRKYFEDFLDGYNKLIEEKSGLKKKIEENNIEEKLKEINFRLNNIKERIDEKNNRIQKLETELSSVKINELIGNLEKGVKEVLNKEIKIII